MTMLAYHNDPKIKRKYLARVNAHRKADELIQGSYWADGKGCAVGCTIHGSSHAKYETELGIPQVVAQLEDSIFEGLDVKASKDWPSRFLKAIKPGADLSMVWPRFALWLTGEKLPTFTEDKKSLKAIKGVSDLYAEWVSTGVKPAANRWRSAAAAARWSAAAAAARWSAAAAADAAARCSAAAAAAAARWSAAAAADAAARWSAAAAADAARNKFWHECADTLERLLSEANP